MTSRARITHCTGLLRVLLRLSSVSRRTGISSHRRTNGGHSSGIIKEFNTMQASHLNARALAPGLLAHKDDAGLHLSFVVSVHLGVEHDRIQLAEVILASAFHSSCFYKRSGGFSAWISQLPLSALPGAMPYRFLLMKQIEQ